MDRDHDRGSLVPRSFFRFPSFFPGLWEEMGDRVGQWMGGEEGVTVSEDDQNVYVEANLPGLKANEIDISLNHNTLWIKGERQEEEEDKEKKYYRRARNSFFYQVELPSQVEESSEQAQFQNGILKISFRKAKQSRVRKIAISENQTQRKNSGTQAKNNKS